MVWSKMPDEYYAMPSLPLGVSCRRPDYPGYNARALEICHALCGYL